MLQNATQTSVTWSSQAANELSIFEKQLAQEVEPLQVQVPFVGGKAQELRSFRRTYDITVEPKGHAKKAKDLIREAAKSTSYSDYDHMQRRDSGESDGVQEERCAFRRERLKRFQVGNHFPALVTSPRIVPSWSLSRTGESSVNGSLTARRTSTPRARLEESLSHLTKPTISNTMKHQAKHKEEAPRTWLVSGAAGTGELISDRRPALFEEKYDTPRLQQHEEYHEAKERWVGDATILPPSRAEARAACDPVQPLLQSHIAAVRERGRARNESLKERYEVKRQNFQKELKERGPLSSFEKCLEAREKAAEEATRKTMAKKDVPEVKHVDNSMSGLKGLVGLKK